VGQELAVLHTFFTLFEKGGVMMDGVTPQRDLTYTSDEAAWDEVETATIRMRKYIAVRVRLMVDDSDEVHEALQNNSDEVLFSWAANPKSCDIPYCIQRDLDGLLPRMDASRRSKLRHHQEIWDLVARLPEDHIVVKALASHGVRSRMIRKKLPDQAVSALTGTPLASLPQGGYTVGGSSGSGITRDPSPDTITRRIAIASTMANAVGATTYADSGSVTLLEPHTWYQVVVNAIEAMPDKLLYSVVLTLVCLCIVPVCRRLLDWYFRPVRAEWFLVIMPDIMHEPEAEPGTIDEPAVEVAPPVEDAEDNDEDDQDWNISPEQVAMIVARITVRRNFYYYMTVCFNDFVHRRWPF